jgi:hypothetical protein
MCRLLFVWQARLPSPAETTNFHLRFSAQHRGSRTKLSSIILLTMSALGRTLPTRPRSTRLRLEECRHSIQLPMRRTNGSLRQRQAIGQKHARCLGDAPRETCR